MAGSPQSMDDSKVIRALSAGVAVVVVADALAVGAPGLALLAVPFIAAAILFREGHLPATIAMLLWSALYTIVGVNYAIANGLDAGWGDLLFAYVGTPLAAGVAVMLVRHPVHMTHAVH